MNVNNKKQIFYWRNNKNKEIKAVGVLFIQNGKVLVQIKTTNDIYEDIGGKTEIYDKTYFDTVSREVSEEINDSFYYIKKINKIKEKKYLSNNKIKKLIKNNKIKTVYLNKSKYLIFIVNIPLKYKIDFIKYGNYQKKNNIKRKLKWINIHKFIKLFYIEKLHYRLRNTYLINFFKCFI